MAQRAIEELDKELARTLYVPIEKTQAQHALTELELIAQRGTALPPGLTELRAALQAAIGEAKLPADEGV